MALEIKQELRLSQQLVMTPQLQQAIKLLQLSRLELAGVVEQELQENPVLEETMDVEEERDSAQAAEAHLTQPEPETAETAAADQSGDATVTDREPTDAEKIADVDWQNYMDAYPQTGMAPIREDDERPSIENTLSRSETLAEHLEWQLQLASFKSEEVEAAHWIIGNIDDDGYLQSTIEEICGQSGIDTETVEAALVQVQSFDPTGVGARDLRECLLIQCRVIGLKNPLAIRIIDEHVDALTRRDFRGLARALGIPIEEVSAAADVIGQLEPKPGRPFGGDDPVYIIPDIYVYKLGDDFHVQLNEDGLPKLRISNLYREVLSKEAGAPKETREYVQEKVRSALWLIKSIHQRQRTIYKVMQSIIRHQREFFDKGIAYLKPLNLRDVAEDIEMHESTVSRVTTNKYAHTSQGIFELKYFFNSSINRTDGEAIASASVKEKIRKIIAAEDPRRPLSDQRIAEMLKAGQIDIARRTVTKYREAMNVLSSTKRRQVG
ncbi:MAG: RNA polymerase factor sigma-54 [Deltaproteobacteria bacterium]|nr:RNA polymerase factor sigma-54 [Deltaproteobacteria bacterium]MBW2445314.1 RNA polymerase factor sigma-54 [Deltaproteobacteria bacterium]